MLPSSTNIERSPPTLDTEVVRDMVQLLLLVYCIHVIKALRCGTAFSLPLEDVLVAPNITNSYITGIPAAVGTPPQNVVLLPWAELNNTYLYDQNAFCDKTVIYSDTICRVRRGGFYLELKSDTFNQKLSLVDAGGAPQETSNDGAGAGVKDLILSSLGGTDIVDFASTGLMNNFPIGIPREPWDYGYSVLHPLGLGTNSTYINALYNAGTISSRVWSIYWGRMWTQNNPLNGSVVLGGYDERKTIGNNFTQKLDYSGDCFTGLKVTITDIVLNFRGGQDQSLMSANTAIPACIVPTRQLLFQGPPEVLDTFQKRTGVNSTGPSYGIHWAAMVFNADSAYDGDITFKLGSSLQVRVPNDQFVTPGIAYERNGSRVFNESSREVLLGSVYAQVATLGRYFLTASYLMVDYDEGTWTLWKSNPTPATSLKTIVRNPRNCSESTADAAAPSSLPHASHLSGGAIAGISVSVILVAIFVLVALVGHWKRKKRSQQLITEKIGSCPQNAPVGPQELHGTGSPRRAPGISSIIESKNRASDTTTRPIWADQSVNSSPSVYHEMPTQRPMYTNIVVHS